MDLLEGLIAALYAFLMSLTVLTMATFSIAPNYEWGWVQARRTWVSNGFFAFVVVRNGFMIAAAVLNGWKARWTSTADVIATVLVVILVVGIVQPFCSRGDKVPMKQFKSYDPFAIVSALIMLVGMIWLGAIQG